MSQGEHGGTGGGKSGNSWEPFRRESALWEGEIPYGDARLIGRRYEHQVPNEIASLAIPHVSERTAELVSNAIADLQAAKKADRGYGGTMEGILLRTEAINSSRIEGYRTSIRNLALAAAGARKKKGAAITAKNFLALTKAIKNYRKDSIAWETIRAIHADIMEDEPFAGQQRTQLVWIGGETPLDAASVPPSAEAVPALMSDFVRFLGRDDIDVVTKIAVSHAQFECIHPFADGNGRTGRAITQLLLDQSGFPTLPVSAAMFAVRKTYYRIFGHYADGEIEQTVFLHALAVRAACAAVQTALLEREMLLEEWLSQTGSRKNTYAARALAWISDNPAFTIAELRQALNASPATVARLMRLLSESEIIQLGGKRPSTIGRGEEIWEAHEIYELAQRVEDETAAAMQSSLGGVEA